MRGISIYLWGVMLVYLLVGIGVCYLEVKWSKAEEWWKGLILPLIAVLIGSVANLPAIVLLMIYAVNRRKIKKNRELEEMKIKDL